MNTAQRKIEEQSLHALSIDDPNIGYLIQNQLLSTIGSAKITPSENTEIIISRILDAIAQEGVGSAYFGEIREDKDIQQYFYDARSKKKMYSSTEYDNIIKDREETLFESQKNLFHHRVGELIKGHEIKKNNKKNRLSELKKNQNAAKRISQNTVTEDIDNKIKTYKKFLNKIANNRENAGAIENTNKKIAALQEEKQKLLQELLTNTEGSHDSVEKIEKEMKEIESIISEYNKIASGSLFEGETFNSLKKQYITHKIHNSAVRDAGNRMYTHEEGQFQNNLTQRMIQEIQKRTLPYPGINDPKSLPYLNKIRDIKKYFIKLGDIKEHLFNIIIELIQMNFLESCLKECIKKDFTLHKAPFIDDIGSNSDCILSIKKGRKNESEIIFIDLKNMYWKEEKKYDLGVNNASEKKESNGMNKFDVKNQYGFIFQEVEKKIPYATYHQLQIQKKDEGEQPYIMKISPSITRSLLISYIEQLRSGKSIRNSDFVDGQIFDSVHTLCSKEYAEYIQKYNNQEKQRNYFTDALDTFLNTKTA